MIYTATVALLHTLVFVYWLGGDLGAFYTSLSVSDARRPLTQRLLAARLVGNLDMAPRSALILTLPTGLTLAAAHRWLELPAGLLLFAWVLCALWLALVWYLHRQSATHALLGRLDTGLRVVLFAVLIGVGVLGLAHRLTVPPFLAWKLLLFSGCIALGLGVRTVLRPFGAALSRLNAGDEGAEQVVARSLGRARTLVVLIWILIATAAWLGLGRPV